MKSIVDQVDAQVNAQVNAQVDLYKSSENFDIEERILTLCQTPRGIVELSEILGYRDRRTVRKILKPLLEQGRIAMTIPDKPNSRFQKYKSIK